MRPTRPDVRFARAAKISDKAEAAEDGPPGASRMGASK